MGLIKPIEKDFDLPGGGKLTFILSKFPATVGREIITQYPTSGMPKVGDYKLNEELMFKLLSFVAVKLPSGEPLELSTRALVDNHIPDWETLMKVEWAMMEYNCSFFQDGKMSNILGRLLPKVEGFLTKTLTQFVQSLQEKDSRVSTN